MRTLKARLILITLMLAGLPLLGAYLTGRPLMPYFKFPPETTLQHAGFSWAAFTVIGLLCALMLSAIVVLCLRDYRRRPTGPPRVGGAWPWWGSLGVLMLSLSWILAWTRLDWFAPLQAYTFTPLWLSYILVINALDYRLSGASLLSDQPRFLGILFPLSALFWWYFEYLNRYVQNWTYTGIEDFGPIQYSLHATLAFSTVLPAVISTLRLWQTLIRPPARALQFSLAAPLRRRIAWGSLFGSGLILFALSIFPNYLFPFLWVAPLVLLLSLQNLEGEAVLLQQLRQKGWQVLYLPALAALTCGFFWEMWNYFSYAKWVYSIPYIDRFPVFEMPLLGYAGYLPFGVECLVIAMLSGRDPMTTRAGH